MMSKQTLNLYRRRIPAFSVLPITLALLCQCLSGATYYVAPNGSDANPGSMSAPVRTLQRGVNLARAGDTVVVRDGTYYAEGAVTCGDGCDINHSPVVITKAGTATAYITIKAEHKWAAVLDCQLRCDSYFNLATGAAYIAIEDFVITHGYWDAIHSNDNAHDIRIRGNRIEHIANRSTSTGLGLTGMYTNPACHNFVIDGNVFHDIGRTNNSSSLDHALYLHGSNYTVTNNIFYSITKGWAIQAADGLNNVLIANNTFAFPNPGQDGQIMLWNTQSNIRIRNNIFYDPTNVAIARYQSSVSNCTIDHNIVYGANGVITDASGCSLSANRVGTNPGLTNAVTAPFNFRPKAGSPAIDTGTNVANVADDFDGVPRPQGSSTDVGAYEYKTTTAVIAPPSGGSGTTPSGLVANWTFNQTGGSTALDSSGNGNNGTLHGVTWATLGSQQAIWLNGKAYISVPEKPSLEMTQELTVAAWIHPGNSGPDPRIVTKQYCWNVKLNGAAYHPQLSVGGKYAMAASTLALNRWYHIAFTFSIGRVAAYVNGTQVPLAENTFTGTELLPIQTYGLNLGTGAGQTNYYTGFLDGVRLYNRALSASEIHSIFSSTLH